MRIERINIPSFLKHLLFLLVFISITLIQPVIIHHFDFDTTFKLVDLENDHDSKDQKQKDKLEDEKIDLEVNFLSIDLSDYTSSLVNTDIQIIYWVHSLEVHDPPPEQA